MFGPVQVCAVLSPLLVVRRIDDDAAQRVSLCRRMWLLSPKADMQTWPHTVQADSCRVVGGGGLRCWCLRIRFASVTSICCCPNVVNPLSQTARHSSRSLAEIRFYCSTVKVSYILTTCPYFGAGGAQCHFITSITIAVRIRTLSV